MVNPRDMSEAVVLVVLLLPSIGLQFGIASFQNAVVSYLVFVSFFVFKIAGDTNE